MAGQAICLVICGRGFCGLHPRPPSLHTDDVAICLRSSGLATLGEGDLVQYAVELRPHLVSLGAPDVAKCAFRFCLDLGGRSLRLVMIEIEVTPAASVGKALRVLDGHIGSVESAGEITPPRRLVREPSGFSAGGKVSCSSLKKMVPSGNEPVFR